MGKVKYNYLKIPTSKLVKEYNTNFYSNKNYVDDDNAIKLLVNTFPNNNKIEEIIVKVYTLNFIYKTYIIKPYNIAVNIFNKKIDNKLRQGDPSVVDDIAIGHNVFKNGVGKEFRFYSFATKYCYYHNNELFPLYDRYLENIIWEFKKNENASGFKFFSDFKREDLKEYSKYINILNSFKQAFKLTEFSIRELDIFLWSYGKEWWSVNKKNKNK